MTALLAGALGGACAALVVAGAGLLMPLRDGRRDPRPPVLVRGFALAGVRLRARWAVPPGDLAGRIAAAGRPGGLGPRELMASKLAAALAGVPAGLALAATAPGRLGVLVAPATPVLLFLAPDLWLARRTAERARRARRELPAMLDLLRVTVEAGAPLGAGLAEVGRRAGGPLADEWRAVGTLVSLGEPLEDALAGMAERLPLPEVESLVAALERARRHGSPLARALSAQAREARFELRRRVQEQAARAGPKIQLVVALLLVPSVLLLVAAALVTALLTGGGEALPI
ncbi:MAG: type II secretion system F family protein [Thermoleophilaceae bacterium]